MDLCQGFIFLWIVFHHARIIPAASLRSEYLGTSFHDEIKSYPDQKLHNSFKEQSNYYHKRDENAKFRPMLPYERRNRPIFTSKTYFGKNQMKELPRKYWASEEDKMISPLRVKDARYMHPLKYLPHRSPRVEFNHQKHKIPTIRYDHHQVEEPDQNVRYVYGPNPGYASRDEYGPDQRYITKNEYGRNPGYAPKEEYGHHNPGYAPKEEYGHHDPGYAPKEEYGHHDPGYAPKEEYGHHDPGYAPKEEYGHHDPGYAPKEEYGHHGPGYAPKEEYGHHDPGYAPKKQPGYIPNGRYDPHPGFINTRHNSQSGYRSNPSDGFNPEHNTNIEDIQNHRHRDSSEQGLNAENNFHSAYNPNSSGYNLNLVFDTNFVYDGNAEGNDLEDDIKKKLIISRIDELQKVDKLNEDDVENKNGKGDYRFLMSDKDSDIFVLGTDSDTSTHTASNSDFNIDENLKKDELLRNSDEEKFRKMPVDITSNESEDIKELEEFEGSGDTENEINTLNILDRETNKSARILDIFSRFNDSAQCTTPKNESGHCRGLTECPLIETMENFSLFLQYMCFQRGRIVGICCPDNPVIEVKESTDEKSSENTKLDIQQPLDGCGLSDNTRIVGGTMSLPHEFSWMVALLRRNRFYCGGVIINNWYILTAAHCVLGIKISDLKVRLGEFDFQQRNDIQHDIPVTEIKRHAHFVTSTFQHDIALLKLKKKIEYTKFIGTICLPGKDEDFSKKNATVAGWGTVSFGGAASPVLRKVTVPVWDNKECDRTYVFERINESFMCAGSSVTGEDACQGDSGGPLMSMNDEGRWEVIGIVSWGRRCGDPSYPGVYTRVTSYLEWIAENAQ